AARESAPVTLTASADATNLLNLREQFKESGQAPVPTLNDLLLKLVALALKAHPALNARWSGDEIVPAVEVHVCLAVDAEAGLLAPVVRRADALPLRDLSALTRRLIEQARQGKADGEGGTFTLTNLGMFGIDAFTPIINWPQVAILGVGRIAKRPAVEGGAVVARDLVTLSLTFDHRATDGAPAARFLQEVVRAIENPAARLIG
ncbi:MAG: 2-oxo acid dehydrogenase subunit E2, partial [Gemmataceae bacterium]|nr:2-oxo acid dehydrogenase subunit E2 [Gemmataceae bacterium]